MKMMVKKSFVCILILSSTLFPLKSDLLSDVLDPLDLANAIWDIFMEMGTEIANETIGKLDTDYTEIDELEDISSEEYFESQIQKMFEEYTSTSTPLLTNVDQNNQQTNLELAGSTVGNIIDNLSERGVFRNQLFPFSEEEFSNILTNIYVDTIFNDIPNKVFGPADGLGSLSTADQIDSNLQSDFIQVTMTPEYPAPGDMVDIKIEDFGNNSNNSFIEWSSENIILLSGVGENTLRSFQLNSDGLPEIVSIFIRRDDGSATRKDFKIIPSEIDIIYETYTYTPPFYKGKSDVSSESLVKIIAIPHVLSSSGNRIPTEDLNYRWRINDDVMTDYTGRGFNKVYYEIPFTEDSIEVTVEIESPAGEFKTTEVIVLSVNQPEVLIYQDHPTLGTVYSNELKNSVLLENEEITFRAAPFFFNKRSLLSFNWKMNSENVTEFLSNIITLRNEGGVGGETNISLEVNNREKRLQKASKFFDIIFNE